MSRPKPKIILEYIDNDTGRCEQILEGDALYVVCYDNKPFNYKLFNTLFDYPGPAYKRTTYANPGHAYNLAERLNGLFGTDRFSVRTL